MRFLSELLERHFGEKVVVLIDEYDAPISNAADVDVRRQILNFIRCALSPPLKGNSSLQMAVLTGVTQISKESISSGLNNLVVDSILGADCDEMFGFSEDEVRRICTDCGHPEKFAEAKDWYDGYRSGNADICNPWSILNYVEMGFIPEAYWVNTSRNGAVKDVSNRIDDELFSDIGILASGGSVEHDISMNPSFDDLYGDSDGAYALLAASGYLRVIGDENSCALSIPNRELSIVFATET